jgi:O-antigen ligase
MSAKTYLRILQGGLIASLVFVFFVFPGLLFPYITSKQLSFNILMELLLAIWLVFIMRYPEYRPKRNYVTWGLLAYLAAIVASCVVSVNFTLSFWGNAERMLGLFHLLHFLIFYLILITVFRSWKEWRVLLFVSVVVATIVSIIGLKGANSYSTIGNTAYVSGYLIFNLFFTLILFLRSQYKNWRWVYAIPAVIMLYEFWSCHTSGAIIGLFLSLFLFVFLLGLTHINKSLRRSSLVVLLAVIVAVTAIFSQYQSAWFQSSFLRNLTAEKATFQTRLLSWKSAAEDFHDHWLFGTGFGNYAIIFDKHFDPKFFNYATTDTYFDRAHNNLIDIASTTGLVGLVTYLSIFAALLYYLIKKFRANGGRIGEGSETSRQNLEIIVIIALTTAYFIQNLAVFDSYVTYIGLMILLGFVYWLMHNNGEAEEEDDKKYFLTLRPNWEWLTLIIFIFIAYLFTSAYNLRPWQMLQGTIDGYSAMAAGKFSDGFNLYKSALTGTPLDHDARVTLINLLTASPDILTALPKDEAAADLDYVISLAQTNIANNPLDSLNQMQLAQVYDTAVRYYNNEDLAKSNDYSRLAMQAIDHSIESSPGRVPVYLAKAQMQLVRGENTDAITTVKYAISLNTDYYEGYCRLSQFYLFLKTQPNSRINNQDITSSLDSCVDLGGANYINSDSLLLDSVNYLVTAQDYPRALKLGRRLADLNGSNAQVWINLAKLYLINGDQPKAQNAAQQAIQLDSTLNATWTAFVKTVDKLTIPVKATTSPAK